MTQMTRVGNPTNAAQLMCFEEYQSYSMFIVIFLTPSSSLLHWNTLSDSKVSVGWNTNNIEIREMAITLLKSNSNFLLLNRVLRNFIKIRMRTTPSIRAIGKKK